MLFDSGKENEQGETILDDPKCYSTMEKKMNKKKPVQKIQNALQLWKRKWARRNQSRKSKMLFNSGKENEQQETSLEDPKCSLTVEKKMNKEKPV